MSCAEPLTLLYRGPLASCNYSCGYCPFEKRLAPRAELEADRLALTRLVGWAAAAERPLRLLFTPWGEALIHPWYQDALGRLSRMPHVRRAAFQTNLSAPLSWLERCEPSRVGIWATYHPASTSRERFLDKCEELARRGVSFSVGVVGLREHLDEIEALRAALPAEVYLWINAFKRAPGYYRPGELARLEAVDPLFSFNLRPQPSRGRPCHAGHDVLSIDGAGDATRCHFVDDRRGNLYRGELARDPAPAPCPTETCRCHIGYVHLVHLGLRERFGDRLLERSIAEWGEG